MTLIRLTAAVLVLSTLTACGIVRDRSNDYVNAEHGENIVIPDWYKSSDVKARYPIPPIEKRTSLPEKYMLPPPPDATITILTENYVIETLDDQSWLLVNETPGRIWPSLDHFWDENGVKVTFENPRLGLMQTEVLGSSLLSKQLLSRINLGGATADRPLLIQAKLGQGVKRNTTELQVRVLDVKKGPQAFKEWSGLPGRQAAEQKLLEIISSYLENNQSYRSYSLLATDIGGASKVALITGQNERPYLKLDLAFDRAWSSATKGLNGAKIKIVDLNRSEGIFYLDYGREEESDGWFSGLFSGGDSDRPEYNYVLKLIEIEGGYQLVVDKKDGEMTQLEEMDILSLLLDNIS
ncbi:outer membrane protein assembly factor BamC [Alkalimarinus alittae]|uniref:Outer membrane protein assembly factor BamC n=1 Tax=Alkalimarinus alittae TaxID=2961619 RepID=A0ABY6N6K5_9ALTE|nr:outer membrane protein assembly factor BamC [Alkalimarinus alittae]UZE97612.1 outer membrane protein assembly factor BamC [Alkalimarinus alittae]